MPSLDTSTRDTHEPSIAAPLMGPIEYDLRSRASRVLIQLAWYTRVLFSGCTVNFREPIDLLRKSIRRRGKCRDCQCLVTASLYVLWAKSQAKAVVVRAKVI